MLEVKMFSYQNEYCYKQKYKRELFKKSDSKSWDINHIGQFQWRVQAFEYSLRIGSALFLKPINRVEPHDHHLVAFTKGKATKQEDTKNDAIVSPPCYRIFHQKQMLFQQDLTQWQQLGVKTSKNHPLVQVVHLQVTSGPAKMTEWTKET